jgi:uncharacterized protein (TIGR02270 family)
MTIWEIVEEHLGEAAFLYGMRHARLSAPHYNLDDIQRGPEARLLAHIDALVVAGSAARERLLSPVIQDAAAEPELVAAAALAILASERPHLLLEPVIAALPRMQGPQLDALCAALTLAQIPEVPRLLERQIAKEHSACVTAAMLRILAAYRVDPGEALVRFLHSDDPATVQAALVVAAGVPRADCLALYERLLDSEVVETRDRALDAALTHGSSLAWAACLDHARQATDKDEHCLLLCGLLGSVREHAVLLHLLEAGKQTAAVLWCAGFAGRPHHVDAVVSLLGHPDQGISKLAGETFVAVTGYAPAKRSAVPANARDVSQQADETFPFDEEDLDAELVPSEVDLLPSVDALGARAWWAEHRGRFAEGTRYLEGQPLSSATIQHALRNGSARRRQPWALGVAIVTGGQYVVSTQAFCHRQLAQLNELARCNPAVLARLIR